MSVTITQDSMKMERNPLPVTERLPARCGMRIAQGARPLFPCRLDEATAVPPCRGYRGGVLRHLCRRGPDVVEDLAVPRQTTSSVTVCFDDSSVADYFEDCVDQGIQPSRCGRVWIHTHPGSTPMPSGVDEETFTRVFGSCDWSVMAIVARGGASYARLSFSAGPGRSSIIPIEVDWQRLSQDVVDREGKLDELFSGWLDEYGRNVFPEERFSLLKKDAAKTALLRLTSIRPISLISCTTRCFWMSGLKTCTSIQCARRCFHEHSSRIGGNSSLRDFRQRDLVPPEKLSACHPLVIGVGAVGRQLALQLAATGVTHMTLVDDALP